MGFDFSTMGENRSYNLRLICMVLKTSKQLSIEFYIVYFYKARYKSDKSNRNKSNDPSITNLVNLYR